MPQTLSLGINPAEASTPEAIDDLRRTLRDTRLPLFARYRTTFTLRNMGNKAAANVRASA